MDYLAYVVDEVEGQYQGRVKTLNTVDLPDNDVLIKVQYSSLNFKDALSSSGNKGVTRQFPHTPGIDVAGQIISDKTGQFSEGQSVLVIGYDLGMNTAGGFGQFIKVPANWILTMPEGMSAKEAMAWGTAGFTAALCVEKLLMAGTEPEQGSVLVTGATGGVGITSVKLLTKLGFSVAALTGKPESGNILKQAGAVEVLDRKAFVDESRKPMLKPQYSAAIDVAGGATLATILKVLNYGGSVATCGLVDSIDVTTTVIPFILRGINWLGVDSVELPLRHKQSTWDKMGREWAMPDLAELCKEISVHELDVALKEILAGRVTGRYILKHD